jgi:branched-chain amino acid transport system permease protein
VRTLANQYAPNVWQMTLGIVMLLLILFLPAGLWSLVARRKAST